VSEAFQRGEKLDEKLMSDLGELCRDALASAENVKPAMTVPAQPQQASSEAAQAANVLVLAAHLMRPEVIGSCLKEIAASKYDFVWTSIASEETHNPINTTFKLKATLIDKTKQVPADQVAVPTVARDLARLQKGELYFRCKISYEAKK
jgi:hypothetical protein